ncbi:MAG: DUF3108 domain-containing protein [bacterium]
MHRVRRSLPIALLLPLLLGGGEPPPSSELQPKPPGVQRLAYTITFLGVPVARALLEESRPGGAGAWTVRGTARTTAFWETFFHIGNAYTTRLLPGGFLPEGYEREVDERGRRYRRLVWYGRRGPGGPGAEGGRLDPGGLPPVPESYRAEGRPDTVEVSRAPADVYNLFAALWYVRYADWERITSAVLPLVVDGRRWELTMEKEREEERKALGRRFATWKVLCTFRRTDGEAGEEERITDYVTQELVRESSEVTFWIERASARRPVAVRVHRPGLTVKGELREPFDDEVPPG